MKRYVSIEEISDGKLYHANDLVKADCGGCRGCSVCCHGMGNSIILDPLDVARLSAGLGRSAEDLLAKGLLELNVVDGIILPNLKMEGKEEACVFLDEEGRCGIHPIRPGICRLFPLGRYYGSKEDSPDQPSQKKEAGRPGERSFSYFLQVHECPYPGKTKVRVRKWVDTPDLRQYEQYIADWHYFLEDVQQVLQNTEDDARIRNINLYLLRYFYLRPYGEEFYREFGERLKEAENTIY